MTSISRKYLRQRSISCQAVALAVGQKRTMQLSRTKGAYSIPRPHPASPHASAAAPLGSRSVSPWTRTPSNQASCCAIMDPGFWIRSLASQSRSEHATITFTQRLQSSPAPRVHGVYSTREKVSAGAYAIMGPDQVSQWQTSLAFGEQR